MYITYTDDHVWFNFGRSFVDKFAVIIIPFVNQKVYIKNVC